MKEQNPINQNSNQHELTNQSANSKLEREGDIFMAEAGNTEVKQPFTKKEHLEAEDIAKTRLKGLVTPQKIERENLRTISQTAVAPGEEEQDDSAIRRYHKEITEEIETAELLGTTKEEKKAMAEKRMIEILRSDVYPSGQGLDKWIVQYIIEKDLIKAVDYLVNKIISLPLGAETTEYREGFYGPINMNLIREVIREKSTGLKRDIEKGKISEEERSQEMKKVAKLEALDQKYEWLYTGSALVHNMNAKIITGQIAHFVEGAQVINTSYLQILQRINFVPQVMRLMDQELLRVRARDGMITSKNYKEVTGTIIDEKGNVVGKEEGTVEKKIAKIIESLPEDQRPEAWELKFAFYTGRNLMNMSLRTAEIIAQGNKQGWRSYPQEAASRLIDAINLSADRFEISEPRGGLHFVRMIKDLFEKDRMRRGWQETDVEQLFGRSRKDYETSGILDVAGMFTGWRQMNMLFIKDRFDYSGKSSVSVEEYLRRERFVGTDKNGKNLYNKFNLDNVNELRDAFLDEKGDLRKEFNHSLGVLLKMSPILPGDNDVANGRNELLNAKREIRIAIWKRIAEENPAGLLNLLHGFRLKSGDNRIYEEIDRFMFSGDYHQEGIVNKGAHPSSLRELETDQGRLLFDKLTLANEIRMMKITRWMEGEVVSEAEFSFRNIFENTVLNNLTEEEKQICSKEILIGMYNKISDVGKKTATHLAEIRFPSNPIMNDLLYEHLIYGEAGEEFFRRRFGSDIPHMHEASTELMKLVDNVSGIPTEKAIETLLKIIQGIGSPQGIQTAQSNAFIIVDAYHRFIQAGGEKFIETKDHKYIYEGELTKWLKRQSLYRGSRQAINKPNSIAQVYAGKNAPALDESEMNKLFNQELTMGVLRKGLKDAKGDWKWTDLYDEFKKKYKTKPGGRILAVLRDLLWIYISGVFADFVKETSKNK